MLKELNEVPGRILYIFGGLDRFNLGDLLFPRIVEFCMPDRIRTAFSIRYVAHTSADFTDRGGYRTTAISAVLHSNSHHKESVILVPGGEVLTCTTSQALKMIPGHRLFTFLSKFLYFGLDTKVASFLLGIRGPLAFLPKIKKGHTISKIAFHSIGGMYLHAFTQKKKVFDALRDACHVAVRDELSHKALLPEVPGVLLFPDTVSMIAHCCSKKDLLSRTDGIKKLTLSDRPYVVFQIARNFLKVHPSLVANILKDLSIKTGLVPVIVPMSDAPFHDDHFVARQISATMNCEHVVIESPTVDEILDILAHASCVIASSLHANIIAIAYGVPIAPLSFLERKTKNYLETWWPEAATRVTCWEDVVSASIHSIQQDDGVRLERAEHLSILAKNSMQQLWLSISPEKGHIA